MLHTVDGGRRFQRIKTPPNVVLNAGTATPLGNTVVDLRFANASDGWLFGEQLWSTHDGGVDWHQLDLGASVRQLEPGANGYVYASVGLCPSPFGVPACEDRVVRSRAGSDSWSTIAPPGNPTGRPELGVHGDSLWVMYFGSGQEWLSHDDGNSFVRGTMPCDPGLAGSLDPVSDSVIWAFCATGNFGIPLVSTNGGKSFVAASGPGELATNSGTVAALSARQAFLIGGYQGTLHVTTDGGRSYLVVPELSWVQWIGFTDSHVGYAVAAASTGDGVGLWRTTSSGRGWTPLSLP